MMAEDGGFGWGDAAQMGGDIISTVIQADSNAAARDAAAREGALNRRLQKQFAQHGIRWRVQDAMAAGLSPLAALGATGASYTPSSSLFDEGPNPAAELASKMGQNVGRAINSTRTKEERAAAQIQLEHGQLQNDLLRSQIALNNANSNPPLPSAVSSNGLPGQGDAFVVNPAAAHASQRGQPAQEAGAINSYAFARTPTGLSVVPSKDIKERIEDDFIQETAWAIRNNLLPAVRGLPAPNPRDYPLPAGYDRWVWHPGAQEFRPGRGSNSSREERRARQINPFRALFK